MSNDTTIPADTRTVPQIEEAARAGDPEAGLSLTRGGVGGSKEERGIPIGVLGENKAVLEAARIDRIVSSYKAVAVKLGKVFRRDGLPKGRRILDR